MRPPWPRGSPNGSSLSTAHNVHAAERSGALTCAQYPAICPTSLLSAPSASPSNASKLFDDELLLRDGRRMRPTVRGAGLAETLPRVLQRLARTIAAPEPFVASRAETRCRIATGSH